MIHLHLAVWDHSHVTPGRSFSSMADIDAYKDKFRDSGRRVLESALKTSKRREQNYVTVEHIMHEIANEEGDLFS